MTTCGTQRTAPGQRPAPVIPPGDTHPAFEVARVSDLLSLDQEDTQEEEDPVRRRTFVGLTGASLFSAMLTGIAPSGPAVDAEPLAPVLTGHVVDSAPTPFDAPPDIAALAAAVDIARSRYQACQYSELIRHLPDLLGRLHSACLALDGDARLRAQALSTDAHHVAAGLLLKLDDQGLAYLAADRSMRAAQASTSSARFCSSSTIIATW